jgi:fructan beta-fructosidase
MPPGYKALDMALKSKRDYVKRLSAFLLVSAAVPFAAVRSGPIYDEQYRPQFHFSPPQQWMNDPNGMVYADGEYHLFYQYNPYANKWGPMHWGHAVSGDMVHWKNLPIALFPDRHGTIFSGSAVLDKANTSGFGSAANPALVAVFTYHDHLHENLSSVGFQSQGIAYSLDRGRTWVKYDKNPVLQNPGVHHFRDPKVFWFAPRSRWIMTLAVGNHVSFFSSPDLKEWTHESDFGAEFGGHAGVWECPDLFELSIDAEGATKDVLMVSVGSGAPNGGSGTQYFVGRFDGREFTPEASTLTAARWVDYGTDDYAGSTWSGATPGGRQLFIGWMSNWEYANVVPTQRWRSAMTVPRTLTLARTPEGTELRSMPVAELATLRTGSNSVGRRTVSTSFDLTAAHSSSGLLDLDVKLNTRRANRVDLVFSNAQNQRTVFRINNAQHRYELDRTASGAIDFSPKFASVQTAPIVNQSGHVTVRALVDRSSIEIFINDGQTVFTTIVFPSTPYDKITLEGDRDLGIDGSTVYTLQSIWNETSGSAE